MKRKISDRMRRTGAVYLAILLTMILCLVGCGGSGTAGNAGTAGSGAESNADKSAADKEAADKAAADKAESDKAGADSGAAAADSQQSPEKENLAEALKSAEESSPADSNAGGNVSRSIAGDAAAKAGIYRCVAMGEDGAEPTSEEIDMMSAWGFIFYMELREDGTVYLNSFGEEETGTWDGKNIQFDGEPVQPEFTETGFVLTDGELTMVFEKITQEELDAMLSDATSSFGGGASEAEVLSEETYVLCEGEGFRMTVTGIVMDPIWDYGVQVLLENESDKQMTFAVRDSAVNGYMCDPLWSADVAAGKKANETMYFPVSNLEEYGITEIEAITMRLRISDTEDWLADPAFDEIRTIYPTGKDEQTFETPARISLPTESVVVDRDGVTFVILGAEEDPIWGYTLHVYLENQTDKTMLFSWEDVSVNGFMVDPFWAEGVLPGMRSYGEIHFSNDKLADNKIEAVEEIEFGMRIYDNNDWMADELVDETFTWKAG